MDEGYTDERYIRNNQPFVLQNLLYPPFWKVIDSNQGL